MFDEDNTCQDCNYPGNGKCSTCNGTGANPDILDAFAEALGGVDQDCPACGTSGKCTTCGGSGYN